MLSSTRILAVGLLGLLALSHAPDSVAVTATTCAVTSDPKGVTGPDLDTLTLGGHSGTIYDDSDKAIKLARTTGSMPRVALGITDQLAMGCAADFDNDGWDDIVGGDYYSTTTGVLGVGFIKVYQNKTGDNPEPNWDDLNAYRTPSFITPTDSVNPTYIVEASNTIKGVGSMLCEDFDNDGNKDFLLIRCASGDTCNEPARAVIFRGRGNGTFYTPYDFFDPPHGNDKIGRLYWEGTRLAFFDYDGDHNKDLLIGLATQPDNGEVIALLNNTANPPKFSTRITFLKNLQLGSNGATALAVADYTNDGLPDILIGGEEASTLKLYPGLADGTFGTAAGQVQSLSFTGGAVVALAGDFARTGKMDVIVASDRYGSFPGFNTFLYKNNSSTTPFPDANRTQITSSGNPISDVDFGVKLDYDHDPEGAPDFILGNSGSSGINYYLFANRVGTTYVDCGTVTSTALATGDIGSPDSSITQVTIAPVPAAPLASEGTVTWEGSNDGGATWHTATPCVDDPEKFCASFLTSTGTSLRWRATLCSNTGAPAHKSTPSITSVTTSFTFEGSQIHFRAGAIARDKVIYVPAFREPGQDGKLYAIDDDTGTRLWEAGALLDTAVNRKVYTVTDDKTVVELTTANVASLLASMVTGDTTIASAAIDWFYSKRFGYATMHALGAIINSTPALLSAPGQPAWYPYLNETEKAGFDTFQAANLNRQNLVFAESKDGVLHAFYTNPGNPADGNNGKEAWAFMPNEVLHHLIGNKADVDAGGSITSYPDGSPSLADVKIGDAFKTVLVSGMGNGGRTVFALDVTGTVSSGSVVGPTPLWSYTDSEMGNTSSKPAIIRVRGGDGNAQFLAVFGSGKSSSVDVGDKLYAVDLASGALVWSFDIGDTGCYISTDIVAAETDDEPGTSFDGYVDRIMFADNKGRVWKLDAGGASLGTVDVGLAHQALFSTSNTAGALSEERAIAGTMIAATDNSRRLVLYFGTGGTEDTPADAQNAFYAVYVDTGVIRSKLDASTGLLAGVKFYGGMVYNGGQIIFTRGQDTSVIDACSASTGEIVAMDANTFTEQFVIPTNSKIVGPIYASGGSLYAVTLSGRLLASGAAAPVVEETSGDTSGNNGNGKGQGNGNGSGTGSGDPNTVTQGGPDRAGSIKDAFTIVSWRQVL